MHAPGVARELVRSDRRLAARAVEDATRTRERLQASNVSCDESAAARRALDRGRYESPDEQRPVRYIERYRQAWIHARRAPAITDETTVLSTRSETLTTRLGSSSGEPEDTD